MATKDEMAAELAEAGIEVDPEEYSWQGLDNMLKDHHKLSEGSEETEAQEDTDEAPRVTGSQSGGSETKFTLERLRPYSQMLFGVPGHVLVYCHSAGYLDDPATKSEVSEAVKRYKNERSE